MSLSPSCRRIKVEMHVDVPATCIGFPTRTFTAGMYAVCRARLAKQSRICHSDILAQRVDGRASGKYLWVHAPGCVDVGRVPLLDSSIPPSRSHCDSVKTYATLSVQEQNAHIRDQSLVAHSRMSSQTCEGCPSTVESSETACCVYRVCVLTHLLDSMFRPSFVLNQHPANISCIHGRFATSARSHTKR
ncbi:hypothetical protein PYCCODRAFT_317330 [Trametes coccinea BRFM310]|uniref:Uncharacterized protein n=1 Tax=Trametes coccinea (strain BRFM310) TaxID=1353009 RepID=A0A1Y2IN47_TRAC3|nr:hypothetical protein PYCCODRAFT_317330 [Trametes coccinea BRFM310]